MTLKLNLDAAKAAVKKSSAKGLTLASEHVLQVSNQRVPIEEGTLMRSGKTTVDENQGLAAISYDTKYAVRQHEDMSLHHDNGRQPKYLESALNDSQQEVLQILGDNLKEGLA